MADSEQKVEVKKFCGDKDIMQGAKPCANCTCGLREQYDALKEDERAALETGNTESACGKCYMGDAFRCASCPYRGLPAFEKGDKVKLITKDNEQTDLKQDRVQVAQPTGGKVVLDTTDDIDF